ncbi:MAG: VOC family protein [Methylophilaceae bacterium]
MHLYITIGTNNMIRAMKFYNAVLPIFELKGRATNGEADWEDWAGYGKENHEGLFEELLWLCGKPFNGNPATHGNGSLVGFKVNSWNEVDRFYAVALANGGTCEGAPGLRLNVAPDFYAAYVRDPDGNKLASVCEGFTESQN